MHLFEEYLSGGVPVADTWLSTLPYWILDWQHTDFYIQVMLDEYNRNALGGPDRRDITTTVPQLPVGTENVLGTPAQPGIELSNLVIAEQEIPVPPPPTGETTVPMTDAEWLVAMGIPATGVAAPANVQGDNMSVWDDLGDLAFDVARQQLGLNGPTAAPLGPNVTTVLNTGADLPGYIPRDAGGNLIPVGGGGGVACATGPSPVYKKVCGVYKWVYPKRRRRRALLTEGDYNSLLRIEGLKVNKNMTAAIAKALTR